MCIRNMYLGLVIQLLLCSIHVAKNTAACVVEVISAQTTSQCPVAHVNVVVLMKESQNSIIAKTIPEVRFYD